MQRLLTVAAVVVCVLGIARTSRAEILGVDSPRVFEVPFIDGTSFDLLGLVVYSGGIIGDSRFRVDVYDDLGGPLRMRLETGTYGLDYGSFSNTGSAFTNFDGGALVMTAFENPVDLVFIEFRGFFTGEPGYQVVYRYDFPADPSLPPPPLPGAVAQVPEPSVVLAMLPGAWLFIRTRRRRVAPLG